MDHIKIIFFDIDGTLIDFGANKMSPKALDTLRRLKEKGIRICLATGRSPMTLPAIEGVEFDAFLTFNGSYCFTPDATIFSNPIPTEDIGQLVKNAAKINRPVSLATRERMGANGADRDLIEYFAHANHPVQIADDFEALMKEEIFQVMMGCRQSEYAHMMKGIRHAKITAWWDRAVDIIPADSGKGRGIQKILDYYHLDKSQAMAFGDGNNDIEMLQSVGTGVAMENASPQLKDAANDFCGHVGKDGVYTYCLEHGLI